jgi:hypothetical protein
MGPVCVDGVGAAGVVHVRAVVAQAVVGRVVEPAKAEGRPVLTALGGVVEDDVEDDLQPGGVQRLDHGLEVVDRPVLVVRREEPDRLIAPVVAQSARNERPIVDELVYRQQLDRGHPQRDQVIEHCRVPQAGERPAGFRGHVRMQLGEALDVQLIEDRVGQCAVRAAIVAPVERRPVHDGARDVRGRVRAGREHVRVPRDVAGDRARVRVQQELGGVAAPGPVDAVAVSQPVGGTGDVRLPDVAVAPLERVARLGAGRIEET